MKERVIVLKTVKYLESDLILNTITSKGARLNLIAKSALKSKKRFGGGVLEPTHFIEIEFKPNKRNGLDLLTEARIIEDFHKIRDDYEKLEMSFYFLKVMLKVCREGEIEEAGLFDILGNALKALEKSEHILLLKLHFEAKVLLQQGLLPENLSVQEIVYRNLSDHAQLDFSHDEHNRMSTLLQSQLDNYFSGKNSF